MSSPPGTLPDTCLYLKVLLYSPMAAWLTGYYNCPSPCISPIMGIHEASWKQNLCLTSHCNPEYKSTFPSSELLDKNSIILPSFAQDFDSISKHIGVPPSLGFGKFFSYCLLMTFSTSPKNWFFKCAVNITDNVIKVERSNRTLYRDSSARGLRISSSSQRATTWVIWSLTVDPLGLFAYFQSEDISRTHYERYHQDKNNHSNSYTAFGTMFNTY